ncbi:MAG: NAD(P)-binding protein [Candidatus Nanopelagicales bacterium]|nr:NAD(P)-binding protein [Candidatus Nanopelagicales bacterium]MDZ4249211.1 NAD(P)-binding protein [Candidatus Nanopelagicales bacterium]
MDKPFAITLDVGSSLANKTGSWRTKRPVYRNSLPPCNDACPAGENIQGWLFEAESGDYEAAWRILTRDNPMPAVMGRVCYHPCQKACNRGQLDKPVGINSVEQFLGDMALREGWRVPVAAQDSGKRVLVIGAGPSGLSAAYHLRLLGHEVVIKDAGPKAGGMLRFGIPTYRLPRDVLDAEVARILDMGVTLELDTRVDHVLEAKKGGGFDAVFLAVGAHIGKRAYIPAGSSAKVLDAVSLLRSMEGQDKPLLGRHVVVYGGGNTAMDAARTAKRLGAEESVVVYRRTRDRMPAHDDEVEGALEEGVLMKWLSTIKHMDAGHMTVERMELDDKGFPQPTGEIEELEADSLVLALGQEVDLSLLDGVPGLTIEDGVVDVDSRMMTGSPGIFAGGDMVPSERTVTVAIGHGKLAARNIDGWLRGQPYVHPDRPEVASFDRLNTWYYADAPRTVRESLDLARRMNSFDEVKIGLDESNAVFEARRCLSCGNCFNCDNCFGVCPDNSVSKFEVGSAEGDNGRDYAFKLDYCKGCGICVNECPSGAIVLVPEEI